MWCPPATQIPPSPSSHLTPLSHPRTRHGQGSCPGPVVHLRVSKIAQPQSNLGTWGWGTLEETVLLPLANTLQLLHHHTGPEVRQPAACHPPPQTQRRPLEGRHPQDTHNPWLPLWSGQNGLWEASLRGQTVHAHRDITPYKVVELSEASGIIVLLLLCLYRMLCPSNYKYPDARPWQTHGMGCWPAVTTATSHLRRRSCPWCCMGTSRTSSLWPTMGCSWWAVAWQATCVYGMHTSEMTSPASGDQAGSTMTVVLAMCWRLKRAGNGCQIAGRVARVARGQSSTTVPSQGPPLPPFFGDLSDLTCLINTNFSA